MSSSNKIDLLRDFAAGVYLSETQNTIPPTPQCTVYVYTVYLLTQGRGGEGGELNQREGERGNRSQSCVENTNDWLYLQSINSDKHQQQSPFTGQFF